MKGVHTLARQPTMISLDVNEKKGLFTIDPYGVYLSNGDTVRFNAAGRIFKVLFHGESPFREQRISDGGPVGTVKSNAGGNYPYAVAIVSRSGEEVFLEAHCPSIIVQ